MADGQRQPLGLADDVARRRLALQVVLVAGRTSSNISTERENAGFTHLALVQIGGDHQDDFLEWAQSDLLPALRR